MSNTDKRVSPGRIRAQPRFTSANRLPERLVRQGIEKIPDGIYRAGAAPSSFDNALLAVADIFHPGIKVGQKSVTRPVSGLRAKNRYL